MPDKKPPKPQVAENPIADVFEGRRPSPSEKDWAEKTLLPTLEKSPEKPIGAPLHVAADGVGAQGRRHDHCELGRQQGYRLSKRCALGGCRASA